MDKIRIKIKINKNDMESCFHYSVYDVKIIFLQKYSSEKIKITKEMEININKKLTIDDYIINVVRQRFIDSLTFEKE